MTYQEQQYRKKILAAKTSNDLFLLIATCLIVFVSFAFVKALWYFNNPDDKLVTKAMFNHQVMGLFT